MATRIHGAGPLGERSPGLDAAIAGYLAENGGGGGVELVSGVVDLDGTGSPVREFYCTASATIEGVAFDAGDTVVWRRTPANEWGYILVEPWTDISGTTTTTTTAAATTTTTTTAATTTTTTTAAPGTLTYQGYQRATSDIYGDYTYTAPIGTASASRVVVIALVWRAGAARDPSLTVNGGSVLTPDYSTLSGAIGTKFYHLTVAAGTTADIVVNSAASYWPAIGVWTTDAAVTFVAGGVTTVTSGATTASTGPVSAANGGFALAAFRSNDASTISTAWTGATERWDSASAQPTSGADSATTGPHTVSTTFTPALTNDVKLAVATYDWA